MAKETHVGAVVVKASAMGSGSASKKEQEGSGLSLSLVSAGKDICFARILLITAPFSFQRSTSTVEC